MANLNVVLSAPAWVYNCLEMIATEACYKSLFYSLINTWLGCYFTVLNGFMVKPQPKIQPLFTPGNNDSRASLDSYNGEVLLEELGGREISLQSPDFIIVWATDDIANDIMVLIVEVKLGKVLLQIAVKQLMDYLLSMWKKISQDPSDLLFNRDLRSLLVIDNDLHILSLRVNGSQGFAGPYTYRDGSMVSYRVWHIRVIGCLRSRFNSYIMYLSMW